MAFDAQMRAFVALLLVMTACATRPAPPTAPTSGSPPAYDEPQAPVEPARPRFVLHAADVGTGLALFVEGEDFSLVYDAGSNDDQALGANNRFVRYLKAVKPGLARIEHVVLSHPHTDHVELLADVVTTYPVGHVWDSGAVNDVCGYRRFLAAVAGSPVTTYHSGAKAEGTRDIEFGKADCGVPAAISLRHGSMARENEAIPLGRRASMRFLHVDPSPHGRDYNRHSLVTLLDLDGTRVLLMGDAEAGERAAPASRTSPASVEGYVLRRYHAEIDADVLVAGHHGSLSSSRADFVAAVSPKVSIISSGPFRYGKITLPDAEVVSELAAAGELLRTDLDDVACGKNPAKIGTDADRKPGGCDNVQIVIQGGSLHARDVHLSD